MVETRAPQAPPVALASSAGRWLVAVCALGSGIAFMAGWCGRRPGG